MTAARIDEKPDLQVGLALGDRIAVLGARISVSESEFLRLVFDFDDARWWEQHRMRSCAHWLSWRLGMALVTAREKVRVARALQRLTDVRDGLANGTLNYSQARDITRVGTVESQGVLIKAARTASGSELSKICKEIRQRHAAGEPPRAPERIVRWRTLESGMVTLQARLLPEEGQIVRSALEAALRRAIEPAPASTEATTAIAPVEVATARSVAPVEVTADERPVARAEGGPIAGPQQLADALVSIMEASVRTPARPLALRHEVGVLVDCSTLVGVESGPRPGRSELLQGLAIPPEAARRLACHGTLRRIVVDQRGLPLDLGRRYRTVSDSQLWALWIRDGGCRFPDCSTRTHLQGHHIVPWSEGGNTDLENLTLQCRYHHWLVHEGGYSCRFIDGRVAYFDRQGVEVPSGARPDARREAGPHRTAAAGSRWKEVRHWVDRALSAESRWRPEEPVANARPDCALREATPDEVAS